MGCGEIEVEVHVVAPVHGNMHSFQRKTMWASKVYFPSLSVFGFWVLILNFLHLHLRINLSILEWSIVEGAR